MHLGSIIIGVLGTLSVEFIVAMAGIVIYATKNNTWRK